DSNEARLGPDGRTLCYASDRTLPQRFPRTRAQAEADQARAAAWDNGSQNIWCVSLAPWLDAPEREPGSLRSPPPRGSGRAAPERPSAARPGTGIGGDAAAPRPAGASPALAVSPSA